MAGGRKTALVGLLDLGQVGCQVVHEPAVPGPEALPLGRLGLPHDAEPVVVGVEGHDPVVPHPESLSGAREVQVLGREAQEE